MVTLQGAARLSYSEMEIKDNVDEIEHRIFREALKFLGIERGIELHSTADVPANCGLGSSSSFTVALLNALHAYKREFVSQRQLAEEACRIEIDLLGELLHVHWETKRKRSQKISDPFIDECYEVARRNGAIGSKLVGAGGGGFLMLYCNGNDKPRLIETMQGKGLRWERFHFDFDGAKILVNT
jgi:galactokinase/mevalonate kinase-like predicted kinase